MGCFYLGELPSPRERCVAVVGARMCTNYGRSIAVEVAEVLENMEFYSQWYGMV